MKAALVQIKEFDGMDGAVAQSPQISRVAAWFDNLERVPEGHATIFYLFVALVLWAIIGVAGVIVWMWV
ncbi:MAG: hypothetical protein RL768_2734 [Nitrospirota bacterium]|jgi:hypothetical protein